MPVHTEILLPVLCLIAWTLVMWLWMYATRIPAILKSGMKLDPNQINGEQMSALPANVRWKADNYNHLMEQPTIFYALVFTILMLGLGSGLNLWLAWTYVVLRVIHSLVQVLGNVIERRFVLFFLSSFCLLVMVVNTLLNVAF